MKEPANFQFSAIPLGFNLKVEEIPEHWNRDKNEAVVDKTTNTVYIKDIYRFHQMLMAKEDNGLMKAVDMSIAHAMAKINTGINIRVMDELRKSEFKTNLGKQVASTGMSWLTMPHAWPNLTEHIREKISEIKNKRP